MGGRSRENGESVKIHTSEPETLRPRDGMMNHGAGEAAQGGEGSDLNSEE